MRTESALDIIAHKRLNITCGVLYRCKCGFLSGGRLTHNAQKDLGLFQVRFNFDLGYADKTVYAGVLKVVIDNIANRLFDYARHSFLSSMRHFVIYFKAFSLL